MISGGWDPLDPTEIHNEAVRNTHIASSNHGRSISGSSFFSNLKFSSMGGSDFSPKAASKKPVSRSRKQQFKSETKIPRDPIDPDALNDDAFSPNPASNPNYFSIKEKEHLLHHQVDPQDGNSPPPYTEDAAGTASGSYPQDKPKHIPIILSPPSPISEPRYSYKPLTTADSRPAPTRAASEPSASTSQHPLLPTLITRRANLNRAPASDPTMDRIDELDETNPLGVHLHHDGPYEAIQKNITAQVVLDSKRKDESMHRMWNPYLAGLAPGQVPDETRVQDRLPIGLISLNLSPGEVLPRKVLKTGYSPSLPLRKPFDPRPIPSTHLPPQIVPQVRGPSHRNHVQPPRLAAARSQSQRTGIDGERAAIPPRHQQLQLQQQMQTQLQLAAMAGAQPYDMQQQGLLPPRRLAVATPPRRQYPQSQADALGQELFLRSEQHRVVSGDVSPTPSIYSNDPYAGDAFVDESSIGHSESSRSSHVMWRGMESASQTSHSSSGLSHDPMSATADRGQWARPWDQVIPAPVPPPPDRRFLEPRVSIIPESELDPRVIPSPNAKIPFPIAPPSKSQLSSTSHNFESQQPDSRVIAPMIEQYQYPSARTQMPAQPQPPDNRSLQSSVLPLSQQRPPPHHVPKRLVMPTPLQGSHQSLPPLASSSSQQLNRFPPPSEYPRDAYKPFDVYEAQNNMTTSLRVPQQQQQAAATPPAHSRVVAQEVPVHSSDTRKLKKRVSIAAVPIINSSSPDDGAPSPRAKSRSVLFSNPIPEHSSTQIARTQSERLSGTSDESKGKKDKKPTKRVLSKRKVFD